MPDSTILRHPKIPATFSVFDLERFGDVIGERLEPLTTFRLFAIRPDGSCACASAPWLREDRKCGGSNVGKHPRDAWVQRIEDGHKPDPSRLDGGGLGLATGSRSGGIVVIDLDLKPGKNGFESLERAERDLGLGPLPERTLTVDTPSGGIHLYFSSPTPIASVTNALGAKYPGIDTRGEGGYVVLPGSPHKAGDIYRVREPGHPIQTLPPSWAARLRGRAQGATLGVPPDAADQNPYDLRARLGATLRGKRGPVWTAWRAIAGGERFFDFSNPPGTVDEWIVKRLFWSLVNEPGWIEVSGESIADLAEGSFATFRMDAAEVGPPSKWDRDHVASKWNARRPAAAGALEEQARADAYVARLRAVAAACRADRDRVAARIGGAL